MRSTFSQRVSFAREVLTADETVSLVRYEASQAAKRASSKIAAYAAVICIWIAVAAEVAYLYNETREEAERQQQIVSETRKLFETKSSDEKIVKTNDAVVREIDKVSQSALDSQSILFKVLSYSNRWEIDPTIVLALIETESNFKDDAIARDYSKTKSIGWSQASKLAWDTFNAQYVWPSYKVVYTLEDKNDTDKSLEFICWYLTWLKTNYPDKTETVQSLYLAYNQGPYGKNSKQALANARRFMQIYNKYFVAMR